MITPALSVLSAIEGLKIVTPAFEPYVVPITAVILIALFAVQSRGTAKVAAFFGPITLVWFIALAAAGIWHVAQNPTCCAAFNPLHGVSFLVQHSSDRLSHIGRGLPGGDRFGSALCRSRPFRPAADPDRMALGRAAGAHAELSRPGRARSRRSEDDRESILPALSRLGLDSDGRCSRPPQR